MIALRRYPREFDPLMVFWDNDAMRLAFPIRDMYISAIDRAEQRIRLTNAYFIPDRVLRAALRDAVQPRRRCAGAAALGLEPRARRLDGARPLRGSACGQASASSATKSMIHAKTCTIDGQWSTIGTANLDRLSAVGNYEMTAEIYSRDLARQMEDLFEQDKTNAIELTLEEWDARPWYAKLSEHILAPARILF